MRNLAYLEVLVKHTEHVDDFGDVLERRRRRDVYDLPEEFARNAQPAGPPATTPR